MQHLPLISIALCSYNGEKYLVEQLDSILGQTYSNIEIVIVDDCSTDSTTDIINTYIGHNSNIKMYVNSCNMGVNRNFEKALAHCSGQYIAISDQDDIWLPNKLMEAYLHIGDSLMIYSNSALMDAEGNDLNRRMYKKGILYQGDDTRSLFINNCVAGHTILFKAPLLKQVLPIPQHTHYDWWIPFIAANRGKITFLNGVFTLHRIHLNNAYSTIGKISEEVGFRSLKDWVTTILTIKDLKHRLFYESLLQILETENRILKKLRLIGFQVKHSSILYDNKGFASRMNRARKINLPYIPQ